MARQRFIWPSMWTDRSFGELKPEEKVLYIALFSLADDEGRISADPMFLRAQIFPYETYSVKKVESIRNRVVERMANVLLYRIGADGEDVIALLKWHEYQKPKYPKPSKIPPPAHPVFTEDSGNDGGTFPPRVGLGWVGLDRDGQGLEPADINIEKVNAVENLKACIRNRNTRSDEMVDGFAPKLPIAAFNTVIEELLRQRDGIDNDAGYARTILERMVSEQQYAVVRELDPDRRSAA